MNQLNEDEIRQISAFVRGPAFKTLRKLVDLQRQQHINRLLSQKEHQEILRTQGIIEGLGLVEGLPASVAEIARELEKRRQSKEDKQDGSDRKARRRPAASLAE